MWTVTKAHSDDEWFEEYLKEALGSIPPSLPAKSCKIGSCDVTWFETEPGIVFINAIGGTPDDRVFARLNMKARLSNYTVAQYEFDQESDFRKTATWMDIMAKAKRLIQTGKVMLLRNGYNNIVAQVQGDHGTYQSEIGRDDPNSRSITTWTCDCPWDQYAWQRTRQWKKYEGRPCAHILATYWKSLSTPLDEDIHPANQQGSPMGQPGQQSLFNMAPQNQPMGMPGMSEQQMGPSMGPMFPGQMQTPNQMMMPPGQQGQQMAIPGSMPGMATGMPTQAMPVPGQSDIIPPYPMQEAINQTQPVVSIPGAKTPTPLNPMQNPGTFSKIANLPPEMEAAADAYFKQAFNMAQRGESMDTVYTTLLRSLQINVNLHLPYEDAKRLADHWRDTYQRIFLGPERSLGVPNDPRWSSTYTNGQMVQTRIHEVGTWQGRDESMGAGTPADIPAGSIGEVLGTDPTGLINVLFMNEATGVQQKGELEPWGITAWFFDSQLLPSKIKAPGPAIKRQR